MRLALLLLVFCAGFHAFAADQTGAEVHKKPVKAEVVIKDRAHSGMGNVRVTYADGTSDFWTKKGNCHDAHVAPDGTVGWVIDENLGIADLPRAYNSTLILCRQGQVIAKISSGCPVIWAWYFLPTGKQVAMLAGWYHASPRGAYELYDVATQNLLKSVPEDSKDLPDWAKPLASGEEQ